jgi:diguanylate cyclase (GGDEF)-like protein
MSDATRRSDRADITKRVERAEKLLQKGKPAEALEEYLLVLEAEPGNDAVCQMASDLCLSLQRVPEAVKLLGELFDRQIADDATRASLTYKKLARYGNPSWEQKLRFGELLENSNRKSALETYEAVFQELKQKGQKQESLGVLQRIAALETNEKNIQRMGELSSETGDGKAAAAAFLKLAEMAKGNGGSAKEWIERAYAENPADPGIALAYSSSLLEQGQLGAAIFILESQVSTGNASLELRESYAKALLAAGRLTDAEPVLWQLFEEDTSRVQELATLMGQLLDTQQDTAAVELAKKLEQFQRRKGERRAFLKMMQEIVAGHRAAAEMLEFMGEQFNASNRESDYSQILLKLFDLHCSAGDYMKAADCFDRAAEVDAYEPGHQKRLETLRGKIDENRFKVIASRFSSMSESAAAPAHNEEKVLGAAALQDLMLQAEILVQYGMRSKALERLQRIQELFPREEERNPDLQKLYMTAGLVPQYAASSPGGPSAGASANSTAPPPQAAADVNSFARVSEITRKIYRQSNADAVMSTTVQEIGTLWKVSRCVMAMRKPGLPLTSIREYCAEGKAGDATALGEVVAAVHDLAVSRGTLTMTDAPAEMPSVGEALARLAIGAVLAIPLTDGTEHVGVLMLTQQTPRPWHSNDVVMLKSISDQIVIALNNAGLRRLVKNLSVTDEKSGLLKRASYLDLLLAESLRAAQQNSPVTVVLLQFGDRVAMVKEFGEGVIEAMMQPIGQLLAVNIRQNDLAFRYEMTTVAIVLGETSEKEGKAAVEKLRKIVADIRLPEKEQAVPFHAGIAEAVVRQNYDPVDVVTEVINRAEQALSAAVAQGPGSVVAVAASVASAAVA